MSADGRDGGVLMGRWRREPRKERNELRMDTRERERESQKYNKGGQVRGLRMEVWK